MKTAVLALIFIFINTASAAESFSTPEKKVRWLNLMGCWENTAKGEIWCNSPIHGPNIRNQLYQLDWMTRSVERGQPPEENCLELGRWHAELRALKFLIRDVTENENFSWELKMTVDSLIWQIAGDNTYLYWDPISSYCIEGRDEYRDKEMLVKNLKRMSAEMFYGAGELDPYGINAAFHKVNQLLGMDIPFDKDL